MTYTTIGAAFSARISAAEPGTQEYTDALWEQARYHVEHNPRLQPHADIILGDWTEGDEHLEWVYSAHPDEVLAWAEEIERGL